MEDRVEFSACFISAVAASREGGSSLLLLVRNGTSYLGSRLAEIPSAVNSETMVLDEG